jgi:hypothetical protein
MTVDRADVVSPLDQRFGGDRPIGQCQLRVDVASRRDFDGVPVEVEFLQAERPADLRRDRRRHVVVQDRHRIAGPPGLVDLKAQGGNVEAPGGECLFDAAREAGADGEDALPRLQHEAGLERRIGEVGEPGLAGSSRRGQALSGLAFSEA